MSSAVERRSLTRTLDVSRVAVGLWQIADLERDGRAIDLDAAVDELARYAEAGFTTFDMADHYGSAEEVAGRFSRRYGAEGTQLMTKWVPPPGPITRADVRTAVERSLERVQRDAIDLLQFHAWRFSDPSWLDALMWLQELSSEGLVRHVGVTNFDTAHLRIALASGVRIVSNQVSFGLLDQRARRGMTELCQARGVSLLAYGTLAGGFLSDRWIGAPEPDWERLTTWSQMKYGRFVHVTGGWATLQQLLGALARVARKHGVTVANVACRVALDQPAVAAILVGARVTASDHVADNLGVFTLSLDGEDRRAIAEAQAVLGRIPGDCGDEYRRPPYLTASGDLSHHLDAFPPPYPVVRRDDGRQLALSGTVWEDIAGFSRATRRGNRIVVSGTTATHRDRVVGGTDPAAQTHFVIDKIEGALQSLGGRLEDVIRTRVYVRHLSDWEPVARAHGERFSGVQPANTLVQADLVGDGYLVEIEADAELADGPAIG
jgi:aryl-alcohol dehydrogenase-like predicted oxidoreductase/enamine deaminase RidA (YjgF/YER057c/UK114 family)